MSVITLFIFLYTGILFQEALANDCINRCISNFDGIQEVACRGACDFAELCKYNSPQGDFGKLCTSKCNIYNDTERHTACISGCEYYVGSKASWLDGMYNSTKVVKDAAVNTWNSVKSGSQWAWSKSKSFLDRFFANRANKSKEESDQALNKLGQLPIEIEKDKHLTPICADKNGVPANDNTGAVWITRLRVFVFGPNDDIQMTVPQMLPRSLTDGVEKKSGPFELPKISAIAHAQHGPQQKQQINDFKATSDSDETMLLRRYMVRRWLAQRAAFRPLMLLGALFACVLLFLSLATILLLIRMMRRRQRTLCAELPKYEKFANDNLSANTKAALHNLFVTTVEKDTISETTDDRTPLHV